MNVVHVEIVFILVLDFMKSCRADSSRNHAGILYNTGELCEVEAHYFCIVACSHVKISYI